MVGAKKGLAVLYWGRMMSVGKKITITLAAALTLFGASYAVIMLFQQHAHYLLLATGVVLVARGIIPLRRYRALEGWGQCTAVVKRIEEREEVMPLSESTRNKYFYPAVEYEYLANGQRHLARAVSLEKENVWVPEVDQWGNPTPLPARWWLSLAPGSELPVFVNPRDEREAVLVRTLNRRRRSHHLALLVAGIILIALWPLLF